MEWDFSADNEWVQWTGQILPRLIGGVDGALFHLKIIFPMCLSLVLKIGVGGTELRMIRNSM